MKRSSLFQRLAMFSWVYSLTSISTFQLCSGNTASSSFMTASLAVASCAAEALLVKKFSSAIVPPAPQVCQAVTSAMLSEATCFESDFLSAALSLTSRSLIASPRPSPINGGTAFPT